MQQQQETATTLVHAATTVYLIPQELRKTTENGPVR